MIDVTPLPELRDYLWTSVPLQTWLRGGLWDGLAPPTTVTPFGVLTYVEGEDVECGGGAVSTTHHYLAQVVGKAEEIVSIRQAALLMHAMLRRIPAAGLAGYHTELSRRERPISFQDPEPDTNGVRYEHRGGQYLVTVDDV